MKLEILYFSPVLLYLTATQLVAGCDHRLNCTECLRSENCEFLRCGLTTSYTYCSNKTEKSMCRNNDAITDIQFCPTTNFSNDDVANETAATIGSPVAAINVTLPLNVTTSTTTLATTTTTTTPTMTKELLSSSSPPPSMFTPMGHSTSINRRFDGPSFIGGIILTFGLLAVTYVGFKFYRARTERNYHTLF